MELLYSLAKDIACCLWGCTSDRAVDILKLPENLEALRSEMVQLKNFCLDVKQRVECEERRQKKCTREVDAWIKSVEVMEEEVQILLADGGKEIQKKCSGTCCPKNCRASYKVGKKVRDMKGKVASKKDERLAFTEVALPLPAPAVIQRSLGVTVGVDSFFDHVCQQLQDEKVTTVGLYGIGGVGKTTLLTRINNWFLKTEVEPVEVIWVTVSKPTDVEKVQQHIFKRLVPTEDWSGGSEDERKQKLFNVLNKKKFVLLLDDVWEPLDLLAMGIPPLPDVHNSKVVLTTRDFSVCKETGAKAIEVKKLTWDDAFTLFKKSVGEDTINSHPQIPKLAEIAAKECDGLPLALTLIGRAFAGAETPDQWDKKIQTLKNYPEKLPGMENLFSRLKFSYDSLAHEPTQLCFLYCSLFPEDYKIDCDELIRLWIGEGFLDEYSEIKEAVKGGENVIERLKHACLLEGTVDQFRVDQRFVKMHDVIRDMAFWLACQDENKKQNKFVVADHVEWLDAQEVKKWKGAQKISLFNSTGFEEHMDSPSFSNLQTLLIHGDDRGRSASYSWGLFPNMPPSSFPNGLFKYMPNITVLDFRHFDTLQDLPMEIGNLSTLQYLNLSKTGIIEIPKGLENLDRLRCLILDQMRRLRRFPSKILSCLSSLQLFSFIDYPFATKDCTSLIKELEGLNCIGEVSISLGCILSLRAVLNSRKLQKWLKFLDVGQCEDINLLHMPFHHLEKLEVDQCLRLEDVAVHSTFPRQQSLFQLSHVKIQYCRNLKRLTCLAYAPNLKFLWIMHCGSLEEVIQVEEYGVSEIKSELDLFLRLSHIYLVGLDSLRSICGRNLLFPSLKVMEVFGCPQVRKLPFHSSIKESKHLEEIVGGTKWWDQLEWEDETIMRHLAQYFKTRVC